METFLIEDNLVPRSFNLYGSSTDISCCTVLKYFEHFLTQVHGIFHVAGSHKKGR